MAGPDGTNPVDSALATALVAADGSTRLRAALAIGSDPDPGFVDLLIARSAEEPDFFVRDMLTWALTRMPAALTTPKLLDELRSDGAQARSQALHTLSKLRDASVFPAITPTLLRDPHDDVARSAWRAAVILAPDGERPALARELASQLGRGDRDVQLSLSRALATLGADAIEPVLRAALASDRDAIRAHAAATERLLHDPDAGFAPDIHEARRQRALKDRPMPPEEQP